MGATNLENSSLLYDILRIPVYMLLDLIWYAVNLYLSVCLKYRKAKLWILPRSVSRGAFLWISFQKHLFSITLYNSLQHGKSDVPLILLGIWKGNAYCLGNSREPGEQRGKKPTHRIKCFVEVCVSGGMKW